MSKVTSEQNPRDQPVAPVAVDAPILHSETIFTDRQQALSSTLPAKPTESDFMSSIDELTVPVSAKGQQTVYHEIKASEVYQRANEMILEARQSQVFDSELVKRVDKATQDMVKSLEIVPESQSPKDYALLKGMIERLDPKGFEEGKYKITIAKNAEVNARGLSGEILVSTGMLDRLRDNPDALIGVLAHELAHTQLKHAYLSPNTQLEKVITTASSREDVIDFIANRFVVRSAEIDADVKAGNRLRELGISTEPMEHFLAEADSHEMHHSLVEEYDKLIPREEAELLATMLQGHPNAEERAKFIDPFSKR
jgi:predicted Zn-dependent protease